MIRFGGWVNGGGDAWGVIHPLPSFMMNDYGRHMMMMMGGCCPLYNNRCAIIWCPCEWLCDGTREQMAQGREGGVGGNREA